MFHAIKSLRAFFLIDNGAPDGRSNRGTRERIGKDVATDSKQGKDHSSLNVKDDCK